MVGVQWSNGVCVCVCVCVCACVRMSVRAWHVSVCCCCAAAAESRRGYNLRVSMLLKTAGAHQLIANKRGELALHKACCNNQALMVSSMLCCLSTWCVHVGRGRGQWQMWAGVGVNGKFL